MNKETTNPTTQKRNQTAIDESFGFTDMAGAQRITGLSKSAIYKLTAAGTLKHYKPAGKLLFKISQVIDWIEQSGT